MSHRGPDDLLARARASYEPTAGARQRMKSKIDAAVAVAAVASAASSTTPAAKGTLFGAGAAKASTGIVLCAALISASVWFSRPAEVAPTHVTDQPAPPTVTAPEPIMPIAEPAIAPLAEPASVTPASALPVETRSDMPSRRTPATESSGSPAHPVVLDVEPMEVERVVEPVVEPEPAPVIDALAIELGLIDAARAAIARRDYAAARRALDAHALEFPTGSFRDERDVSRIVVLCATGAEDEARRRARDLGDRRLSPRARADLRGSCIE